MYNKAYIPIVIAGLLIVGGLFFAQQNRIANDSGRSSGFFNTKTIPTHSATAVPKIDPRFSQAFSGINIEGKAAYVLDMTTGETLYEKNADESLPLASITKLMTAAVALERTNEKNIIIQPYDLETEGDDGLIVGESWGVPELVAFTLIDSSNDGANTLGRATFGDHATFIKAMNAKAIALGMNQTIFYNESGLDISTTRAGAYGSARDIARLMAAMVFDHRDVVTKTTRNSETFITTNPLARRPPYVHVAHNTNTIVGELPGLIASKTGYTDLAGGNLTVAFDAGINHPIAITVLGSSKEGRFVDVRTLASSTLAYLAQR